MLFQRVRLYLLPNIDSSALLKTPIALALSGLAMFCVCGFVEFVL